MTGNYRFKSRVESHSHPNGGSDNLHGRLDGRGRPILSVEVSGLFFFVILITLSDTLESHTIISNHNYFRNGIWLHLMDI